MFGCGTGDGGIPGRRIRGEHWSGLVARAGRVSDDFHPAKAGTMTAKKKAKKSTGAAASAASPTK